MSGTMNELVEIDPGTTRATTVDDPTFVALMDRLHNQDSKRPWRFLSAMLPAIGDGVLGRTASHEVQSRRFRNLAIGLGPVAGRLAYLTARAIGARGIVEFGTSFGISTLYLAAAIRDNGGGTVIGSELEPGKVVAARRNIAEAGLSNFAEIREGNALETLRDPGGSVDMVLLDGWKDLYLPVLQLLEPHLRPGTVILADNIHMFKRALGPYVAYVGNAGNGYASVTLPVGTGLAYSVRC
jgi:predicted O-methyltransferase YrrM